MRKFIWRVIALYWFWRLARWPSWDATGVLWDSYADFPLDRDHPEDAVRDELSEWGD